ncbi:hypothetical protein [Massilia aerilata]|uniref:Uncharacterized protein n=1 Tax=Massilia aerilata TaxID=453817 RepID=A0ABW0S4R6_9BURK
MGKVLPQGQPDFGGVDMAAIIRHFRGSGERACRFGISEKTAYCALLPHLRPSFAENKFNRPEKFPKTGVRARILVTAFRLFPQTGL